MLITFMELIEIKKKKEIKAKKNALRQNFILALS